MARRTIDFVLQLKDVVINDNVFRKISRAVAGLPGSVKDIGSNFAASANDVKNFERALHGTEGRMLSLDNVAGKFFQRMAQFAILLPTFATLNKAIQGGAKFIGDFESELSKIERVSDLFGDSMGEVRDVIFDIGKELGASASEVSNTVKIFAQAGLTVEDAMEKSRIATLASKVTTLELAQAQEILILTSKQLGEAGLRDIEILDKLAVVEDASASDAQDLAEALTRGGNAMAEVSKNVDFLFGFIAALREQTRKTGAEIGTFAKTLVQRLFAVGEARSSVEALGITIENLDGSVRPLEVVLADLKTKFDSLSEAQRINAAKAIAGVRQAEFFIATMNSLGRANEIATASYNSQGRAQEKLAIVQDDLNFLMQQTLSSLQELSVAFGNVGILDFFKDATRLADSFAQTLAQVLGILGDLNVNLGPLFALGAVKAVRGIFGAVNKTGGGGGDDQAFQPVKMAFDKLRTTSDQTSTSLNNTGSQVLQFGNDLQAAINHIERSIAEAQNAIRQSSQTAIHALERNILQAQTGSFAKSQISPAIPRDITKTVTVESPALDNLLQPIKGLDQTAKQLNQVVVKLSGTAIRPTRDPVSGQATPEGLRQGALRSLFVENSRTQLEIVRRQENLERIRGNALRDLFVANQQTRLELARRDQGRARVREEMAGTFISVGGEERKMAQRAQIIDRFTTSIIAASKGANTASTSFLQASRAIIAAPFQAIGKTFKDSIGAVTAASFALSSFDSILRTAANNAKERGDVEKVATLEILAGTAAAGSLGLVLGTFSSKLGIAAFGIGTMADVIPRFIDALKESRKNLEEAAKAEGATSFQRGRLELLGSIGGRGDFIDNLTKGNKLLEVPSKSSGIGKQVIDIFTSEIARASGDVQKATAGIVGKFKGPLQNALLDLNKGSEETSKAIKQFFGEFSAADIFDPKLVQIIIATDDRFKDLREIVQKSGVTAQVSNEFWARLGGVIEGVNKEIDTFGQKFGGPDGIKTFNELITKGVELSASQKELSNMMSQGANIFASSIKQREAEIDIIKMFGTIADKTFNTALDRMVSNLDEFGFESVDQMSKFVFEFNSALDALKSGRDPEALVKFFQMPEVPQKAKENIDLLIDLFENSQKTSLDFHKAVIALQEERQRIELQHKAVAIENERKLAESILSTKQKMLELGVGLNQAGETISLLGQLTQEEFKAILDNVSELPQEIQDAVRVFAGTDVQKAMQAIQISTQSFALTIEDLNSRIREAETDLATILPGEDKVRRTGESVFDLEKKLGDLRVELSETITDRDIALAQNNLELRKAEIEAAKEAAEAAEKLRQKMEALRDAQDELSNGLTDMRIEAKKFTQEKVAELLERQADAQQDLKDSQREVISGFEELDTAFDELKGAIIQFNDAMASAQVEANLLDIEIESLGGGVAGFNQRLGSLSDAFNSVLNSANISLVKRIELERQLASETLQFLQEARSQIVQAGLDVFGQDASSNRALSEGISGLNLVAEKLGGSFDAFLRMGPQQFEQVTRELLSLPVELRQNILKALESLPSTVPIAGFALDELKTALGQIGAGIDPGVGLPAVEDILSQEAEQLAKLQELAIRDAELQVGQIFEAKNQVAIAEMQLEQLKINEARARESLDGVRTEVLEEKKILDAANKQRELLTNRLVQTTDLASIRQIQAQATEFARQNVKFDEITGNLRELIDTIAKLKISVINAEGAINGARGFIPNFAGGSLRPGEVFGLMQAASREKRLMPPGAGLAVANTSEMIIPTRNKGFIPNFQGGSDIATGIAAIRGLNETLVAAIARSVTQTLGTGQQETIDIQPLTNRLDTVIDRLEDLTLAAAEGNRAEVTTPNLAVTPGGEVAINLTTNQNNTVQVTGLQNLAQEIVNAIVNEQRRQANVAIQPLNEAISSIFQTLRERGIISSFGGAL